MAKSSSEDKTYFPQNFPDNFAFKESLLAKHIGTPKSFYNEH